MKMPPADPSSFICAAPAGPDRFDIHRRGNTQICVWQNDDLSVVMTGDMSAREMLKVANLTYNDLNF